MAVWAITPSGVESVLKKVVGHGETLQTACTNLGTDAEAVGTACTKDSAVVLEAFGGFFDETNLGLLKSAGARVGAGSNGVVAAVKAYFAGDEAAALEYQRNITSAPRPAGRYGMDHI